MMLTHTHYTTNACDGMKLILHNSLMFGYWGSAWTPWLMILSSDYKDHKALIAHEQCHQEQQRRDGWLTFWWRYITSKRHRLAYELEAYRAWLQVAPQDAPGVARTMASRYNRGHGPLRALSPTSS